MFGAREAVSRNIPLEDGWVDVALAVVCGALKDERCDTFILALNASDGQ